MRSNQMIIETKKLCKSYALGKSAVPVLSDISLSVHRGEYISIMGKSGAGKSTLLNILGCLDVASSGEYILNQKKVSLLKQRKLSAIRNREIGFVFQNFNLLPKLTVFANIELALIYSGVSIKKRAFRVKTVMEELGIESLGKRLPNEISGGERQRVAIARAIIKNPSVILADEPTGNLDSGTTEKILSLFQRLHSQGNTIIMITHESDVAGKAERGFLLQDGYILENN